MPDGIRAQWHIADPDESDPFQTLVASTGTEIDLTAPTEELQAVLAGLIEKEARFDSMELTCEYKDAGQDCRTCLHANARTKSHWALCEVGREEQLVSAEIHGRWEREHVALIEMARSASAASEIGYVDPALLAQAGL